MHILDKPALCGYCKKFETTRAYGANNTPVCRICQARVIRPFAARITRHDGQPQAIDAWEPGDPI